MVVFGLILTAQPESHYSRWWAFWVDHFNISYLLHPFDDKLLTVNNATEYEGLFEVGAQNLGGNHAAMTWLVSRVTIAVKKGDIDVDQAAMVSFYDKLTNLRMLMARLPDMYDGRVSANT